MEPRLVPIAFGIVMVMSTSTGSLETIAPSEIARLDMGTTTWPDIERRRGPGRLIGRSAPHCGIRSAHAIAQERGLEPWWQPGVVCERRIGLEELVASGSADRLVGAGEDA
jgi:hypothetical protein